MIKITFSQRWRLEDYVQEHADVIDRCWDSSDEITWLKSNGFYPTKIALTNIDTDIIDYSLIFYVPEEIKTFLLLKYPAERTTIPIMYTED